MAAARPSAALYQKTKLPDIGGAAARACCLLWRNQTQCSGWCGAWLPFSMGWKWWWLAVTCHCSIFVSVIFPKVVVVYCCFSLPVNYLLYQLFLLVDIFASSWFCEFVLVDILKNVCLFKRTTSLHLSQYVTLKSVHAFSSENTVSTKHLSHTSPTLLYNSTQRSHKADFSSSVFIRVYHGYKTCFIHPLPFMWTEACTYFIVYYALWLESVGRAYTILIRFHDPLSDCSQYSRNTGVKCLHCADTNNTFIQSLNIIHIMNDAHKKYLRTSYLGVSRLDFIQFLRQIFCDLVRGRRALRKHPQELSVVDLEIFKISRKQRIN